MSSWNYHLQIIKESYEPLVLSGTLTNTSSFKVSAQMFSELWEVLRATKEKSHFNLNCNSDQHRDQSRGLNIHVKAVRCVHRFIHFHNNLGWPLFHPSENRLDAFYAESIRNKGQCSLSLVCLLQLHFIFLFFK